jgi:hypothetical protein
MRREQRIGKHGQNTAAAVLSGRCGINMVEQVGTPVLLIPVKTERRNTYQVIFGEKVSGDHRGLIGDGKGVLAETKTMKASEPGNPSRVSKHKTWTPRLSHSWIEFGSPTNKRLSGLPETSNRRCKHDTTSNFI